MAPVGEIHPELFHYTNGKGLQGIIEAQSLRATNIYYLNDAEEHTGYIDRRLPPLLRGTIRDALASLARTDTAIRINLEGAGGLDRAAERIFASLHPAIREATTSVDEPYITSFCAPSKRDTYDGLLSQWRAYGEDGGYAVVFDTKGIEEMLQRECKDFHFQYLIFGDVEYFDNEVDDNALHAETVQRQNTLKKAMYEYIQSGLSQDGAEGLWEPISTLSCMCKHRGFREENEVRIVALRMQDKMYEEALEDGPILPRKTLSFRDKNGLLVPFISLFDSQTRDRDCRLPIKRIIIGPHPDRSKRRDATLKLLAMNGITAEVMMSNIPYIGR